MEPKGGNPRLLARANEPVTAYRKPIPFVEMQFMGQASLRSPGAGEAVILEKAAAMLAKMLRYRRYPERCCAANQ